VEVEAALRSLPEVVDVVVRAVPDGLTDQKLVAWLVPDRNRRTPSPAAVRSALGLLLPDWMVPRDVVLLAEMPRNERGKVDVAALPAPPERSRVAAAVSPTERRLEAIWSAVLRLDHVGRDESFTALGGDSLAVEEMLVRVHDELGPSLTAADLAEHATLDRFASLVDRSARRGRPRRGNELVHLQPAGSRPPVFCFAGAGGAGAFFEAFAAGLGPDRGVYALQAHGFDERGIPDWTVGRAARRHLRAIEEVAPSGPVALVGHSFGGLLALRVAQLLCRRGRQVPLLTVLDTFLPPAAQPADRPRQMGPTDPAGDGSDGLWRTRVRLLGAGLVRYDPTVQQDVFHEQGARVARFHRPRPWAGEALVFMSEENPDDPDWWRTVLTGQLQVRRVRTDHLGLLRPPYVSEVTEPVRAALEARERLCTEGPAVLHPQA
jgi:thioesterase domain-containing protein